VIDDFSHTDRALGEYEGDVVSGFVRGTSGEDHHVLVLHGERKKRKSGKKRKKM
jgi:hypothetical protein